MDGDDSMPFVSLMSFKYKVSKKTKQKYVMSTKTETQKTEL